MRVCKIGLVLLNIVQDNLFYPCKGHPSNGTGCIAHKLSTINNPVLEGLFFTRTTCTFRIFFDFTLWP